MIVLCKQEWVGDWLREQEWISDSSLWGGVSGWLFYASMSEWVIALYELKWVDDCFMQAGVSGWLLYANRSEWVIAFCEQKEWICNCCLWAEWVSGWQYVFYIMTYFDVLMLMSALYKQITIQICIFLFRASSLRKQQAGRYVTQLGHIIMTPPSQPVFRLTP
jgi:hypothetical protein